MPAKEPKKSGAVASLIRNASNRAKSAAEDMQGQGDLVVQNALGRNSRIFNVLSFIEAPWGLKMKLFPVQRFIVKLYYNIPLNNRDKTIEVWDMFRTQVLHRFTETEYLRFLNDNGRCNLGEQDHVRRQLLLSIGRRAGKTTLSAIFASYELYRLLSLGNPQEYYGLPDGNRIQIISIATGKDQAGLLFNDVTSHIAKCDWFQPFIANNTQSYVQFRTPSDIEHFGPTVKHNDGKFQTFNGKASIRVTFKPAISSTLRGSGNIVIILDEMAHFQGEGKSSAKDIYDAVTPSAAAFSPKNPNNSEEPIGPVESRIICISSPLNKAGKFYELYDFAMSKSEGSENMIAIQAPTWEVNPTIEPQFYRERYHEDANVFMTEYGAEFSDRVRGWIDREADLIECIDPTRVPKNFGPPRYPHQMGVDVGLIGDGTCIAITHVEGDKIVLDYHESWYAGKSWRELNPHLSTPITDYARTLETVERLEFDEISKWIHALSRRFYITDGLFDRWNGIPLEQALIKLGMRQFKSEFFTRDMRSQMYQAFKSYLIDKKIVLYDQPKGKSGDHKRFSPLIEEFLALQANQTARNQVVVEAKKVVGAHDDMADAVCRAIWLSLERLNNNKIISRAFGQRGQSGSDTNAASLHQYQMRKARTHGVFTDRATPRNPLLRRRGR